MRLGSRSLALTLAAACSGAACSAAPPAPTKPAPPRASGGALPRISSPARWLYRPDFVGRVTARLETEEGCLYGTELGHRWLAKRPAKLASPGPRPACEPSAMPAPDSAEETLVALFVRGGELIGLGDTGSVFRAPSALAPFEHVERASRGLFAASGSAELLLAASRGGALLELQGSSLSPVGGLPSAARVVDVAVLGKAAIVLAMPERVFVTADGARSFDEVKLGPIGAHRATLTRDGALAVLGHRGHVVWRPGAAGFARGAGLALEPRVDALSDERPEPTPLPSARAALEGTATLVADRYFQVIHAHELPGHAPFERGEGSPWVLLSGKIDGPLEARPLTLAKGCASVTVGGALGKLAFACVTHGEGPPVVRVTLSDADLTKPELVATLDQAPLPELPRVAVSSAGSLLVTGACVRSKGAACPPGPVLVSQVGGAQRARHAAVADLQGPTDSVAFSPDGSRAYFLGRLASDDAPALFSSSDAGATFTGAALALPSVGAAPPRDARALAEPLPDGGPSVGEDGTVGFGVVLDDDVLAWATVDEAGSLAIRRAEPSTELIAGFGRRAFALRLEVDDGDATPVFIESLDGGATWARLQPPEALTRSVAPVYASGLACGYAGCLVGDGTVRLGWRGDVAPRAELPPRQVRPLEVTHPSRAALACETVATAGWQRLAGANGREPPDELLARGKSLWSLSTESDQGEVVVHASDHPEAAAPPKLTSKVLLGKRPAGKRVVDLVSHDAAEGFVAVRVALPAHQAAASAQGTPMRDVELAWEQVIDGVSGRARIADAGVVEPGDLREPHALSGFVSMSRKGVFVRPHHRAEGKAFYAEPSGKVREVFLPALPKLPNGMRTLSTAAALLSGPAGDEPLVLGLGLDDARRDHLLLLGKSPRGLATRDGEPWSFSWTTVARGSRTSFVSGRLALAHVGARELGLVAVTSTWAEGSFATYAPLLAAGTLGPPLDLPMPHDLPSAPRPCTARERRDTPRAVFESPYFAGTQHLVTVNDLPPPGAPRGTASASLSLLTEAVVVQGAKASPCVAAWSARARYAVPQREGPSASVSAVIAGDPRHAWLVRAQAGRSTEVRPMRCKLDPSAPTVAFSSRTPP